MLQPNWRKASTKSPMGRSCIRSTPDSSKSPPIIASAAVSGLIAVPAFPRNKLACLTKVWPPSPSTFSAPFDATRLQPSCLNASNITLVSSDVSRSCTVVVPLLSAARSNTRFEMLLEPGSRTLPPALTSGGISKKSTLNMLPNYLIGFGEEMRQVARLWLACSMSCSSASPSLLRISFSSDCSVC